MDKPKSLDSLFRQKIFRIPDYQRGYAWQREQLRDFWEDLVNLSDKRSHYTGLLTLKQIPSRDITRSDKEFWLVEDHSYQVYHIVDGQQRLTTFVVFLQAFVEFVKELPDRKGKLDDNIYLTESLTVADLKRLYLFETKPTGGQFRTYKFGYTADNPSYDYLRFRILGEEGGGDIQETFYTLNLENAKRYFAGQLSELHRQERFEGLQHIYKKLTKQFLFNEYVIEDEFDVFIAFETMNNRGKKLSDLELLKNRLIYLTTLYGEKELDDAGRKDLRDAINDAWKEAYHQLGRNKARPLNDDDFLRAHWIMYFKYSRQTGQDYIRFLLNDQFTPKNVNKKAERDVLLDAPREQPAETAFGDLPEENGEAPEESTPVHSAQLQPGDIRTFVMSLKESAQHWFRSFYPELDASISDAERSWIDRLNRVGMAYFRPLVMAVLKNVSSPQERIDVFRTIERFIFIAFRMNAARTTYGSSEFYNAARELDQGNLTLTKLCSQLDAKLSYTLNEDGSLRIDDFYNGLFRKFKEGSGYYGWSAMRYFLYEYELQLLQQSRQEKVNWNDLLKSERDMISIEHICPQTETDEWSQYFTCIEPEHRRYYQASLGNLLLLSKAINSSLQNDSFEEKKHARFRSGEKVREGYSDGSHSEIEVSRNASWGPEQIKARGIDLLKFMEARWNFRFRSDEEREKVLFLDLANRSG